MVQNQIRRSNLRAIWTQLLCSVDCQGHLVAKWEAKDRYQEYISVFVFCSCHNKMPQNGLPQTTDVYCLTALEAGSLKSRCQLPMLPSEALGENLFLPLLASGGSRSSLACGCVTQISAFLFTWPLCLLLKSPSVFSYNSPRHWI